MKHTQLLITQCTTALPPANIADLTVVKLSMLAVRIFTP